MEANLTTLKSTNSPNDNMLELQSLSRRGAINLVLHYADTQLPFNRSFFFILSDKLLDVKLGQTLYAFPQRTSEYMNY